MYHRQYQASHEPRLVTTFALSKTSQTEDLTLNCHTFPIFALLNNSERALKKKKICTRGEIPPLLLYKGVVQPGGSPHIPSPHPRTPLFTLFSSSSSSCEGGQWFGGGGEYCQSGFCPTLIWRRSPAACSGGGDEGRERGEGKVSRPASILTL